MISQMILRTGQDYVADGVKGNHQSRDILSSPF